MTASGIPRLHVEKVLNHTLDDVAEIYDRHDYLPEKQQALTRLGLRLEQILTGTSNSQSALPTTFPRT
jgi:hypothetical protein